MSGELIRTKLFVPSPPPGFVARPRLAKKLAQGLQRKLTLISTPAGFGKSTLLSTGTSALDCPVAWFSLDEADNNPVRFWSYFITCLQTVYTKIGQSMLVALENFPTPHVEPLLISLINELVEMPEEIAFVLDDYHVIEAEPVHNAIDFLLEHMPPQFHLVIATRIDPPLRLSLLRGRGQLIELRATDLRFTLEETTAFFNEAMGLGLSDENLAMLEDRTEGWIASLQMTAISIQGRDDIPEFINSYSGTHHYIMDYLTEEILNRQEESIQSFLLKTSILDRLSGPLCDLITGQATGQNRLEHLVSANLFLVPLDDERRWFRYHHLFADLLLHRLNATQPDLAPALHRRASEWFEHEGLMAEAVHHALAGNDFDRAGDLIESIAVPLINESRLSAPRAWLDRLPIELIEKRPWLCVSLSSVYLSVSDLYNAERLLEKAESLISGEKGSQFFASAEDFNKIRNHMVGLQATLKLWHGDIPGTIALCLETLREGSSDQSTAQCLLTWNLGAAYWIRGELDSASEYLERSLALSQSTRNFFVALVCLGYQADIQVQQGHLHKAAEIDRRAIELGHKWGGGNPLPGTSFAYVSMAQVLYQWNRIDEAMYHLKQGIELSKQNVEALVIRMTFPGLVLLSDLKDTEYTARQILEQLRTITPAPNNQAAQDIIDAWMVRLSIAQGDLAAAERWVESLEGSNLNLDSIARRLSQFGYLTLIRVCIARGDVNELPGVLEPLCRHAEAEGRIGRLIEILILQSIAQYLQQNIDEALATLKRALIWAEPEGFLRIFADEGKPMKELLHRAKSRGIAVSYVNRILNAFESYEPAHPIWPDTKVLITPSSTPKPLTAREIEVLRFLAAGATSKEIADNLFLSVRTVKKHAENVYAKLDVHNRTQAINRAHEIGLL